MSATKSEIAWQEISLQLKNPRSNHKLDSDDINRIRIRGVLGKRKKRLLKRTNKGASLQDGSEIQVHHTPNTNVGAHTCSDIGVLRIGMMDRWMDGSVGGLVNE